MSVIMENIFKEYLKWWMHIHEGDFDSNTSTKTELNNLKFEYKKRLRTCFYALFEMRTSDGLTREQLAQKLNIVIDKVLISDFEYYYQQLLK